MLVIAHGIVGRADLPIPEELFGAAAAAVLVVSFLALAAGWSRPRLEHVRERPLFRIPLAVDVVLGAVGVAAFAVTVYAGLAGTDSQQDNLAPTAVYVAFWVGVPFASLLFGDVFRLLSPWRALGRAAGWVAHRLSRGEPTESFPYPDRLGHWPAAAGILAFVVCELCWATGREPGPLGVLMLVYLVVQLAGMGLYGVEAWTRRGDAFGVWFGLFARLAPVGRRADGRLVLRPPVAGVATLAPLPGTVALLLIGIGSTGFDGAKEGPLFNDVRADLQDFFTSLGASMGFGLELAFVTGLAGGDRARRRGLVAGGRGDAAGGARPDAHRRSRGGSPTRWSRSPPRTSSRTTSRCSPTTARTCGASRPTRSAAATTCSAAPAPGSTTRSSRRPRSGTCRSARSSPATSPRSCSRTTARWSSTDRRARPPARRSSCWCSWSRSPASGCGCCRPP